MGSRNLSIAYRYGREWYLTFQEFRARLVIMMDKLLNILKTDPNYKNFTLDGQTIPLEDYLEVRPEKEEEIKKYVRDDRLSIGPFYVLPDEFLVSGESLIRNLLIGYQSAKIFGKVMKTGYIPDPFGHIAQLPQIVSGFGIPSVIFWRGFGEEFEKKNLNVEFTWRAPGDASSVLGIHLILSYGSLADLNTTIKDGGYNPALKKIKSIVRKFAKYTATPIVLLNSGSDHHEARSELPDIVRQWNEQNPDILMEQNHFEYYVNKVLKLEPELKSFQGELRGGKYANLLSGVFSTRMWIKQRNTEIEYLFEKYAEPLSTITWALDKYHNFQYPQNYLLTGLKWLIKNHPHDSICGCSIDQVHDEMKTRFDWSEQIGQEIFKNSFIYLNTLVNAEEESSKRMRIIVYNPLPWKRRDIAKFNCLAFDKGDNKEISEDMKILDSRGNEIEFQYFHTEEDPRYTQVSNISHTVTFIGEVPACGYKYYYLIFGEKTNRLRERIDDFNITDDSIENEFYKVKIESNGQIKVLNKTSGVWYEKMCFFEDKGDWGDEYDFSGPKKDQTDLEFTTENAVLLGITPLLDGPSHKTISIKMNLRLPTSLSKNRINRDPKLVDNEIIVNISLYKGIKRIDFRIELDNRSKDHRIRVLFPSKIRTDEVHCDGHFFVVPRDVETPIVERWVQSPLPTNHQKDFIALNDEKECFAVINKGLPEYEAIKNMDDSVTLAITLLRCVEWLSRGDFASRKSYAGPDLHTPGAQCIGRHEFELSLIIENDRATWIDAGIPIKGKEVNNPLKIISPSMANSPFRVADKVLLRVFGVLSFFTKWEPKAVDSYLPPELSFLEIDNKNILLSAMKKSEKGENLVLRFYNIAPTSQKAIVKLYEKLSIASAEIVNFLEEKPINNIKAEIKNINKNNFEMTFEPHVIATIRMKVVHDKE